jgi:large subunit ribosomal protein L18
VTLASVSTYKLTDGDKTEQAKQAGTQLAEAAKAAGVSRVVFDRAGATYTGRIAAFADAARAAGLEF